MGIRLGTDIVYIPGIARIAASEAALRRIFHPAELGTQSLEHLAGIIAAKEAFFKALGKKPRFLDIEIAHERTGRPYIKATQKFHTLDVSISHDKDYATAVVILEQ